MQEYLHRSPFSSLMDGVGFHIAALFLSLFWFALLWGVRLPVLPAGLSLYALAVLLRKKIRDDRLARKETQWRAALGGEMALERLLLSSPERAHFETAMLLSLHSPLILLQAGEKGVLCAMKDQLVLTALLQAPDKAPVTAGQVLDFQREALALRADRGLLCVCGPVSPEAKRQAAASPAVSFLPREKLLSLLGQANPITDDQLVALGKRKKRLAPGALKSQILHPRRARRYACYGCLLLMMYQFTKLLYYAIPGLICVLLAAGCRCVRQREELFAD